MTAAGFHKFLVENIRPPGDLGVTLGRVATQQVRSERRLTEAMESDLRGLRSQVLSLETALRRVEDLAGRLGEEGNAVMEVLQEYHGSRESGE